MTEVLARTICALPTIPTLHLLTSLNHSFGVRVRSHSIGTHLALGAMRALVYRCLKVG